MPFKKLFAETRNWEKQAWGLCPSFASMFLSHFSCTSRKKKKRADRFCTTEAIQRSSLQLLQAPVDACPAVSCSVIKPHGVVGVNPATISSSHVVSHIYGIQLVSQESISEVHALFLPSRVDGDDAGVYHHHHPYDEVVLLQDHIGDQGHQVEGLLLRSLQFYNHHEQVGPCEHRTGERRRRMADENKYREVM